MSAADPQQKPDQALLVDARHALKDKSARFRTGRRTERQSHLVLARRQSVCPRCEKPIKRGDSIRVHVDYPAAVHDGCRSPHAGPRSSSIAPTVTGQRAPELCQTCWLEHSAGSECP
ncbi:hypothetical protein MAUB1S_02960 [Mycolicibacterium aubagnense]